MNIPKSDVVIIGGGFTGLVTAYLLSKTDLKITLVEKDKLYSGATSLTTAFLTQAVDTSLTDLVSMFGGKKAKQVWLSHQKAIDLLEDIIQKEKIDCDFMRCPAYIYSNNSGYNDDLKKEAETAKKLGFKVKFHEEDDLNFINAGYLEIENQAKFDAIKFLSKLAKIVRKKGVKILEHTEVSKVEDISADWIVIATYLPLNNPIQTFMKKGEYVSYAFEAKIPNHKLKGGIYMDTEIPYHYFRVDGDNITLGGEDHRSEFKISKQKIYQALEGYLKQIMPWAKYKITKKWSGPIIEPADGLALIGKISDSVLVSTGYSGNGMSYGTISGMIFKDIILNQSNPWIGVYDPKRIPSVKQLWTKGIDYTKEFINVAVAHTIR